VKPRLRFVNRSQRSQGERERIRACFKGIFVAGTKMQADPLQHEFARVDQAFVTIGDDVLNIVRSLCSFGRCNHSDPFLEV
jgi:hypothetical protein